MKAPPEIDVDALVAGPSLAPDDLARDLTVQHALREMEDRSEIHKAPVTSGTPVVGFLLRAVKGILRKLLAGIFHEQSAFNQASTTVAGELDERLAALEVELERLKRNAP